MSTTSKENPPKWSFVLGTEIYSNKCCSFLKMVRIKKVKHEYKMKTGNSMSFREKNR